MRSTPIGRFSAKDSNQLLTATASKIMRHLRTTLLFVAAFLMGFAALINTIESVPHLRADLEEISVRPTLLRAIMLGLHFGSVAMFAFTAIVLLIAIKSLKSGVTELMPLWIIGLTYASFGLAGFVMNGSYHMLGFVLIGIFLIGGVIPFSTRENE